MIDDFESSPDALYGRYQNLQRQYLDSIDELDAASQVSQNTPIAPEIYTGGGVGGGGGGGGPCFAGETMVPLFNGVEYPISFMYEHRKNFIGKLAKSFDAKNNIVPGQILHVSKDTIFEILSVAFRDEPEPMRMARQHRFWTSWYEFVSMSSLTRSTKVFNHDSEWGYSSIESKERIKFPEGIDVFNMTIKNYHAYFAFAPGGKPKAVSNEKPIGDLQS